MADLLDLSEPGSTPAEAWGKTANTGFKTDDVQIRTATIV